MTATVRDQLKERLGIVAEAPRADPVDELQRRLRAISPEVVAGDPAAVAEADKLAQEIAAVQRRAELESFATAEQANRERAAAETAAEAARAAATRKLAKLDTQRNEKLRAIETAIDGLEWAAAEYSEFEEGYDDLRRQVDPTCNRRRYMAVVLDRLARRLSFSLLPDVDLPRGGKGFEPLGETDETPDADETVPVATVPLGAGCTVCKREDVEAINAALASRAETGDGLRALGDRYGVSKATLSRHLNHGK